MTSGHEHLSLRRGLFLYNETSDGISMGHSCFDLLMGVQVEQPNQVILSASYYELALFAYYKFIDLLLNMFLCLIYLELYQAFLFACTGIVQGYERVCVADSK